MNENVKALQPDSRGQTFAFGLNPYGLTYHLGLQGAGGPRANPKGAGLEGFIAIATELGAKVLEIYDPWLRAMSDDEIRSLRDRLGDLGMTPIVSSGLTMGPFESALRSARILNAEVIRHGLTNALARAFGSDNIRVNAIEPGAVMTDRQRRLWYKTPESIDAIVQRQSIQTILLGEDIARMALFLGADDSRMVTKQSIIVDAGLR